MRAKARLVLLTASAALVAALYPALGRGPESILPPGFGDQAPSPEDTPRPDAPRPPLDLVPELTLNAPEPTGNAAPAEIGNELDNALEEASYELPPEARRSLDRVGLLAPEDGGFAPDAFGRDGGFLGTLVRRLDAPLASRWASILLRRALLSQSDIPARRGGADWVADRAWLLVRMGEADDARALVQRVDPENYSPWLYTVAMQAALASAEPAALCGIADGGAATSKDAAWPLAQAICAGLAGEGVTAQSLVRQARRERDARGFDVLVAEKVVGAGTNSRRVITLQWDGVEALSAWRFGMAAATGVEIPGRLMSTVGAQVRAWHARAPLFAPSARLGSADRAATLGVFSSAALVDLYGAAFDEVDIDERSGTVGARLAQAYVGEADARLDALRGLWGEGEGNALRTYARQILTARAAAMLAVDAEIDDADKDAAIAAMLSAGLDTRAARWSAAVTEGTLGWGLLAVASPRPGFSIDRGAVETFRGNTDQRRSRYLLAALAGLGRLPVADVETLAQEYRVPIGRQTTWTRALRAAVAARQPGRVVLIAAAGLQTPNWDYVPPEMLYHLVAALRQAGMEPAARMIAAEALTRS